jgi:DNA-directed RNA polymerase subunit RPC12/RpoP
MNNNYQIGTLKQNEDGFRCLHCGVIITSDPRISGVQNRNHCPYCLRSRHLDLYEPGDRLAACKAQMEPVGLTIKRSRNKYARWESGELMLIHQCIDCSKISINRLAADDVAETILEVYRGSFDLEKLARSRIMHCGVNLLQAGEYEVVIRQLRSDSHLEKPAPPVRGRTGHLSNW